MAALLWAQAASQAVAAKQPPGRRASGLASRTNGGAPAAAASCAAAPPPSGPPEAPPPAQPRAPWCALRAPPPPPRRPLCTRQRGRQRVGTVGAFSKLRMHEGASSCASRPRLLQAGTATTTTSAPPPPLPVCAGPLPFPHPSRGPAASCRAPWPGASLARGWRRTRREAALKPVTGPGAGQPHGLYQAGLAPLPSGRAGR